MGILFAVITALFLTFLTLFLEAKLMGTTLKSYLKYMRLTTKDKIYQTFIIIMMFILYMIITINVFK